MSAAELSPAAFEAAWDRQALVRLAAAETAPLPAEATAWLTTVGLPRLVHITFADLPGEISFESLGRPLLRVTEADEPVGRPKMEEPYPPEWRDHWVIGRETFDNGEIDICVRGKDGHVVGLDIEMEELRVYNTSVRRLASSFAVADQWARKPSADTTELEDRLRRIDGEAMAIEESFWCGVLSEIKSHPPGAFLVRKADKPMVWRWKQQSR